MSKKTFFFLAVYVLIVITVLIKVNDDEKKVKQKENQESVRKSEMVAHYGRSGEVELLKISDNNWQLVNYNLYFVTIRMVIIGGFGEVTQSVQIIGAKGNINLKNLSFSYGFYIYNSHGALSGWLRANEIHYLTEKDL